MVGLYALTYIIMLLYYNLVLGLGLYKVLGLIDSF